MIDYCEGCHTEKEIVNVTAHNDKFCAKCMEGIPKNLWFLPKGVHHGKILQLR